MSKKQFFAVQSTHTMYCIYVAKLQNAGLALHHKCKYISNFETQNYIRAILGHVDERVVHNKQK